jgi:hypothetical protein
VDVGPLLPSPVPIQNEPILRALDSVDALYLIGYGIWYIIYISKTKVAPSFFLTKKLK